MPDLSELLEQNRPALEAGIADAEREIAALDARRDELEALIARARAALGQVDFDVRPGEHRKLHDAMILVLEEAPDHAMSVQDLAQAINDRELYRKRDGSPVEPNQIHARASAKTYAHLFAKQDGVVRLRSE